MPGYFTGGSSGAGQFSSTPTPSSSSSSTSATGAPSGKSTFVMTDGWYVALACISGIMLANTRVGPLIFGVLSIALLYQVTLLIQGK
jgi:hypothetical protein